jgi:hypothetical protein
VTDDDVRAFAIADGSEREPGVGRNARNSSLRAPGGSLRRRPQPGRRTSASSDRYRAPQRRASSDCATAWRNASERRAGEGRELHEPSCVIGREFLPVGLVGELQESVGPSIGILAADRRGQPTAQRWMTARLRAERLPGRMLLDLRLGKPDHLSRCDVHPVQAAAQRVDAILAIPVVALAQIEELARGLPSPSSGLGAHIAAVSAREVVHLAEADVLGATSS